MTTYPQEKRHAGRNAAVAVTVVLLIVAAVVGGVSLWRRSAGPTQASASDCRLAQELFGRAAAGAPTDAAAAEKWQADIRDIRYAKMQDEGLSTQVGRYVTWKAAAATGQAAPTDAQWNEMVLEATGHCEGTNVKLTITR